MAGVSHPQLIRSHPPPRGFPLLTPPSDFNDVVEAFGFDELTYSGVAPRTNVVGRVFTANEAPPDQNIPFHHEMPLVMSSQAPKMSSNNPFIELLIPHQKNYNNTHFPIILTPNPTTTISDFTDSIKTHKPWLESLLHKSGAILLRGFPVLTASDFNDVVEAFGFEELPYTGVAPRTHVVGRVLTANEAPPDQNIPFHHEMALVPEFPSKLFFFCEVEPESEGETPLVLSHIVYDRMKEKYPEFVLKLEEQGLIYTHVLAEEVDPSSPYGAGWKSTFSTNEKKVAEERAAKLGIKLEWREDGVKTILGPIPAIKYDKTRHRKIWFNNMVIASTNLEEASKAVTFGDGKPLPIDIIYDCIKILDEECVAIPWEKGDVLLLDNLAVLHSRRSCSTPRRVLASLCK